jgi:hypothetical protein
MRLGAVLEYLGYISLYSIFVLPQLGLFHLAFPSSQFDGPMILHILDIYKECFWETGRTHAGKWLG